MQWFLITLALWLGVAELHGGVLDSEISGEITIADLNIIGIDNVNDISYKVTCETTFTDTGLIQGISLVKNIYDTETEAENLISNDGTLVPCSATIDDEIKGMGGQNIGILLQGLDANNFPVIRGKTNKGIFPNFPTGSIPLTAATDNDKIHLVRVGASNLGDLTLEDNDAQLLGSSVTVTYYSKSANPAGSYKFCYVFDTSVLICDTPANVATADPLTTTGAVVSATLRHSVSEVELEVSGFTGTALDVIHSSQICIGNAVNTATCPVTITSNEIVLDLIALDGDTMKDYLNVIITDYNLIGQAIDSTSLEVRWDFQAAKTRYYITHNQPGIGDFQAASVTCDGGGTDIPCFGYFTDLTPADYIVSVQPKTGIPPNDVPDETNKIESDVITVPAPKFSDPQIKHLQVNWHYNKQSGNIDVCFLHASYNVERVFSHYEFVLINKTGQWLKHKLQTQDTGDLCFSTFDVALQDFDASKGATLIVTQRAEDGFTVLASGKTSVTFI